MSAGMLIRSGKALALVEATSTEVILRVKGIDTSVLMSLLIATLEDLATNWSQLPPRPAHP